MLKITICLRTGSGRRDAILMVDQTPAEGFSEMGLRQFSTVRSKNEDGVPKYHLICLSLSAIIIALSYQVSQLLQKLRTDLHLSFHSFLKEFVAQPNDGVSRIFVQI